MNKKNRALVYFLLWSLFIMLLTGIPGNYIPKAHGFISLLSPDKLVHIFLFIPFAFFFLNFLLLNKTCNYSKSVVWVALIGIVYASLTELLQFYVFIGRNGNIYDFIADSAGLFFGILFFYYRKKRQKQPKTDL